MRVISGECKGRRLKSVPGQSTRPTTDKVRESIFNMIGPYFEGGIGLDLYAGSGALSIEALSRGIDKMIMIDRDAKAIETVKSNLEECNYASKAEVFRNDANRALKALNKRELTFSVIFLDPPYAKQKLINTVETIEEYGLLDPTGKIVVEHTAEELLADTIGCFKRMKHEIYSGTIAVSLYKMEVS
jgi:16S rRNA (guanine966-N2)-methyltransferase